MTEQSKEAGRSMKGDASRFQSTWSLLQALAKPPQTGAAPILKPGMVVSDRYSITGTLGQGGMGVVYLARDIQLERDIALKIQLRGGAVSKRLSQEARALASLSHPNVVMVHEVGEYQGHLFIAMEYVAGETLSIWLNRQPRRINEIVELFLNAGHGLAAAHGAGLVHLDFKPDNVLVGHDGRARVADFGLAVRPGEGGLAYDDSSAAGQQQVLVRLVGTPAYMAPEQISGGEVDSRTDQFAFCVALFEAVYGQRPFAADTMEELLENITSGRRIRPSKGSVPSWLDRILERGLDADPEKRFPSMTALLDELVAGPRRVRRRWKVAAVIVSLALLVASGTFLWPSTPVRLCQGASSRLATVWNDTTNHSLQTAFKKTSVGFGAKTAAAVSARLDDFGRSWIDQHTRACRATRIYHSQSEQALDLSMACLERRLDELRSVIEVLAQPDELMVEKSVMMVGSLVQPENCADIVRLGRRFPPPVAVAEDVRRARQKVFQGRILARAGRLKKAGTLLDELGSSKILSYLPLRAEWTAARAELARSANRSGEAEKDLRETVRLAAAAGDDRILVKAMAGMAFMLASRYAPDKQTDSWLELAWAAARRLGGDQEMEASLLGTEAYIRARQGKNPKAVSSGLRAVKLREKMGDKVALSRALTVLGMAHIENGQAHLGRQALERAVALLQGVVGVEHPANIKALQNLGSACKLTGDYTSAIRNTRQAAEILEQLRGSDDPGLQDLWSNLGGYLLDQGRKDEARAYFERVLDSERRRFGPKHYRVGLSMGNLAVLLAGEKHYQQALNYALQSRKLLAGTLGEKHSIMVNANSILGTIERYSGRLKESARDLGRAMKLADSLLRPGHPGRINPRVELARTELAQAHLSRARHLIEDALHLAEAKDMPEQILPDVWFAAAEVFWSSSTRREQALAYAHRAEAGWENMGMREDLAKVRAWLLERSKLP